MRNLPYLLILSILLSTSLSNSVAQGTVAPTLIKHLELNGGSDPKDFCTRSVAGSKLFFTAKVGGKRDLFCTNGTVAGTVRVTSLQDNITSAVGAASFIFFTTESKKLYKTDGSQNGTIMLKQFGSIAALEGEHLPNRLLFAASSTTSNVELWSSDGSVANTVLLKDICTTPVNCGCDPKEFTVLGGKVYFTALNGDQRELYRSDGTTAGTAMVMDQPGNGFVGGLKVINGKLHFSANDQPNVNVSLMGMNLQPWQTDGSAAGTTKLMQINGSTMHGSAVGYNGLIYFSAGPIVAQTLHNSAGEIFSSATYPRNFTVTGGKLYFSSFAMASNSFRSSLYVLTRPKPPLQFPAQQLATKPSSPVKLFDMPMSSDTPALTTTYQVLSIVDCPSTGALFYTYGSAGSAATGALERFDTSTGTKSSVRIGSLTAPTPIRSPLFYYDGWVYFAADYTGQGAQLYKVQ